MEPRNVVMGGGDACGLRHWGPRWCSLWGHETLYWVWETHAACATATFGGAPYVATKRCNGWGTRMRVAPLDALVVVPNGATKRCA
eukprot:642057-Pyramimonas_sp.AAC.1